ncbi:hypothetical protein AVEN_146841-1 [Araneus ventricosus]|uniref:Uncharacterized protein n=1 Tax=Araneus ventricosus TaxID=182803 RepID=A0A4Y2C7B7_ARAVE|nr:hypothetical protein AVEN_146841-1 [Araneus ventricosus]
MVGTTLAHSCVLQLDQLSFERYFHEAACFQVLNTGNVTLWVPRFLPRLYVLTSWLSSSNDDFFPSHGVIVLLSDMAPESLLPSLSILPLSHEPVCYLSH